MLKAIIISLFLVLLAYACYRVVRSAGWVAAYIAFSWTPLVLGIIWVNFEFYLSPLNHVLPLLIVIVSLLLCIVGLPVILTAYRKQLSASKIIGVVAAAFLYGVPAFLYLILSITGTR